MSGVTRDILDCIGGTPLVPLRVVAVRGWKRNEPTTGVRMTPRRRCQNEIRNDCVTC